MRTLISIALVLTFLLNYSMKWFVIINYEINKAYISDNYCQNKGNKELHCEGKCYLLIELKKEENRQKQLVSFLKQNVELICAPALFEIQLPHRMIERPYQVVYSSKLQNGYLRNVFWPPGNDFYFI